MLAAFASVFRDGIVEKFVSNSTPRSFNTGEDDMRLDPTLICTIRVCVCSGFLCASGGFISKFVLVESEESYSG